MLVDVHCHLHFKDFDHDRDEVIQRAKDNNVVAIINSGTDYKTNQQVLKLAEQDDILKASLGIYPTYVEKSSEEDFQRDIEFIKKNKENIIAIGEVGLDFHHTKDKALQKTQITRFHIMLEELSKLKKPFVLHTRKAEREIIDIMESTSLKKVDFHCFTGKLKLVKKIIDNGWYLSIPPNIVKSEQFQGAVKLAPLSHLLTETDAPYLSPPPKQRNEPSFITKTIEKIAKLKDITQEETQKIIFMNYQKVFLQ